MSTKTQTVFETTIAGYEIRLTQVKHRTNFFIVTYGEEKKGPLDYSEAALELGAAIMHASALEGKL